MVINNNVADNDNNISLVVIIMGTGARAKIVFFPVLSTG